MKPTDQSIEQQVKNLPHRDRARIALALIESLDPGKDEDVAELWLEEAAGRLASHDAGESQSLDAESVLTEIEQNLK